MSELEFGESRRLPYLAIELLLPYLDINALKTLRLVCKATKSLVETPDTLGRFLVRITGSARLQPLLDASDLVPWNSFVFTNDCRYLSYCETQRFTVAYGDLVLHLHLDWHWSKYLEQEQVNQLSLIAGCPNLQSFQGHQLLLGRTRNTQLLKNWRKNLRHFNVQYFMSASGRSAEEMSFFSEILVTCTNLETLTIPYFSGDFQIFMELDHFDNFQRFVLTPLREILGQRGRRLRSIKIAYNRQCAEQFLQLALVCRETGTILHTDFAFVMDLPTEHLSVLDVTRYSLNNVRSIRFENRSFSQSRIEYGGNGRQIFLEDLEIDFQGLNLIEDCQSLERFVDRLVKLKGLTVHRLCLSSPPTSSICPNVLCSSFVNMKILHLTDWEAKEENWLKLWVILGIGHTLRELILINCPNLGDKGMLGDDLSQPVFLRLKSLRRLTFRNEGNGNITELSFMHAFRHMKLRWFTFLQQTVHASHSVGNKEMLQAMWDGPFGETIEHFYLRDQDMMSQRPSRYLEPTSALNAVSRGNCDPTGVPPKRDLGHDDLCINFNKCCSII